MPWNKRSNKRRPLYYYLPVLNNEDDSLLGRIGDITTDGMLLLSPAKVAHDTEFSLSIIIPPEAKLDSRELHVTGRVQWSRPDFNPEINLLGIQFTAIPENTKAQIKALLDALGMASDEPDHESNPG